MGRLIIAAAVFLCGVAAAADPLDRGVQLTYHEPLTDVVLRQDNRSAVIAKPGPGQPLQLDFDAFGRRFQVELAPNASLLPATVRARLAEQDVFVYRGRLTDTPDSWARMVIHRGLPRGTFFDGQQLYSIEVPGDGLVEGAATPVIYRLADLIIQPGQLGCGMNPAQRGGQNAYGALVAELKTMAANAGPGATQNLNIGAVADFEFSEEFGGSAEAALLDRFNRVDGIFTTELGVQITVNEVDIFTADDDPFTTSDPGDLLTELGGYRAGTPEQRAQGLSHLFTGRNLDGTTVGIAFVGALCSNFAGAGLSEGRRGPLTDSLIAAHEMGHNFGADHDGDPNGGCPDAPTTFLMAASINGSDEFSQCSKDQMAVEIAQASCITPLSDVDMAVLIDDAALTVLTGSNFSYGITLDNEGSEDALNVSAAIQLPADIEVQDAEPSAGTCTSGGGAVDCDLGTIPGNSSRTIGLTLQAAMPGDLAVSVSVTANEDIDSSNNTAQGTITANPAVDLAVAPVDSTRLDVNDNAAIRVTVRNDTALTATDVAVGFTLDAGLRANNADFPLGNCDVTDQQVDCSGGTLNANSSIELTLNFAGVSAGQHAIDITASAAETDPDSGNNTATATITVQTAAPVSGSGGGGGGALFWAVLLLPLLARRRFTLEQKA